MTQAGFVAVLCLAGLVHADVMPDPTRPDLSCVGRAEGDSCNEGGRCTKRRVRRPDFSKGGVPTWGFTEVLVCEGASTSPVSLGALLAGVALLLLAARRAAGARAGRLA